MLTALSVGMAGLFRPERAGAGDLPVPPQTYLAGNLLGGLVFGASAWRWWHMTGHVRRRGREGKLGLSHSGQCWALWPARDCSPRRGRTCSKISAAANWAIRFCPSYGILNSVFWTALVFIEFTLLLFYVLERCDRQRKDKMAVDSQTKN